MRVRQIACLCQEHSGVRGRFSRRARPAAPRTVPTRRRSSRNVSDLSWHETRPQHVVQLETPSAEAPRRPIQLPRQPELVVVAMSPASTWADPALRPRLLCVVKRAGIVAAREAHQCRLPERSSRRSRASALAIRAPASRIASSHCPGWPEVPADDASGVSEYQSIPEPLGDENTLVRSRRDLAASPVFDVKAARLL